MNRANQLFTRIMSPYVWSTKSTVNKRLIQEMDWPFLYGLS